jgi:hypothetical protein
MLAAPLRVPYASAPSFPRTRHASLRRSVSAPRTHELAAPKAFLIWGSQTPGLQAHTSLKPAGQHSGAYTVNQSVPSRAPAVPQFDPDFASGGLDEAALDVTAYCAAHGLTGAEVRAPSGTTRHDTAWRVEGGPDGVPMVTHGHTGAGIGLCRRPRVRLQVASALRAAVKAASGGLTASCGVAPNRLLAKVTPKPSS